MIGLDLLCYVSPDLSTSRVEIFIANLKHYKPTFLPIAPGIFAGIRGRA